MKRERVTYEGAYQHVMNRGYDGTDIFAGNRHKSQFLDYLEDSAKRMKIRIFAYCIMDNHYHLVLENSSSRLSDFLKLLNGQYGMYYHKIEGGQGYVFQNRFKSTIIEDDGYLIKKVALKKFNHRLKPHEQSIGKQRKDDLFYIFIQWKECFGNLNKCEE